MEFKGNWIRKSLRRYRTHVQLCDATLRIQLLEVGLCALQVVRRSARSPVLPNRSRSKVAPHPSAFPSNSCDDAHRRTSNPPNRIAFGPLAKCTLARCRGWWLIATASTVGSRIRKGIANSDSLMSLSAGTVDCSWESFSMRIRLGARKMAFTWRDPVCRLDSRHSAARTCDSGQERHWQMQADSHGSR